jgi:aspartyl protease family protein
MSGDQTASSLWYLLALLLPLSALVARQLPIGTVARLGLAWAAIFAVLLGAFKYAQDKGWLVERNGELTIAGSVEPEAPADVPEARTEGQALRIPVAPDGHYWVEGTINGTSARFLIDSGASVTALSETTAKAAGLNIEDRTVEMLTANGRVEAKTSSVATLALGPIRASDLPVVVSPAFGEVNVIGMNMLSRLDSWGVRDREMVLTP